MFCKEALLSCVFFLVLLINQRFVCLVVFAMFFLPLVNKPHQTDPRFVKWSSYGTVMSIRAIVVRILSVVGCVFVGM